MRKTRTPTKKKIKKSKGIIFYYLKLLQGLNIIYFGRSARERVNNLFGKWGTLRKEDLLYNLYI
jgi:hypothetical protein